MEHKLDSGRGRNVEKAKAADLRQQRKYWAPKEAGKPDREQSVCLGFFLVTPNPHHYLYSVPCP